MLSAGRQAVADEIGDAVVIGRILVGQHDHDVTAVRIDIQLAVTAGRTAAMADIAQAIAVLILEAVGVAAEGRIDFSARHGGDVGRIEQFSGLQCARETIQIARGGQIAACGTGHIGHPAHG
jgi:hypothetical protein